jgi:hypothetical protein
LPAFVPVFTDYLVNRTRPSGWEPCPQRPLVIVGVVVIAGV